MITKRSYKYVRNGQISIPKDPSWTKKEQTLIIQAKYGVIPKYSRKTGKFYV